MRARSVATPSPLLRLAALLAFAALAFAVGRWTVSSPPARPQRPAARATAQPAESAGRALPAPQAWPRPPMGAVAALAAPIAPSRELVAAVTAEAATRFEPQRQTIAEACWPSGGTGAASEGATLVVNVTFDRDGNEIARGIQEDRRARASGLTECIRSLGWTRLSVAPPGANIGVTLPIHIP